MLTSPMTLYLDAGNSRLKWGIAGDAQDAAASSWRAEGAFDWLELEKSQENTRGAAGLTALMKAVRAFSPKRAALASVTTREREAALAQKLSGQDAPPFLYLHSAAAAAGVVNGYARPETLGVDRWCALAGARAQHDAPALVVMVGTAITLDALDAEGRFWGGLILPGLHMMRQALAAGAARLPLVEVKLKNAPPSARFPVDTESAIMEGVREAAAGAIERTFARFLAQLSNEKERAAAGCLMSGGASSQLLPRLTALPVQHAPHLVLEGMRQLVLRAPDILSARTA